MVVPGFPPVSTGITRSYCANVSDVQVAVPPLNHLVVVCPADAQTALMPHAGGHHQREVQRSADRRYTLTFCSGAPSHAGGHDLDPSGGRSGKCWLGWSNGAPRRWARSVYLSESESCIPCNRALFSSSVAARGDRLEPKARQQRRVQRRRCSLPSASSCLFWSEHRRRPRAAMPAVVADARVCVVTLSGAD